MASIKKSKIFGAAKPKTVPAPAHGKRKGFAGYDLLGNICLVKFSRSEKMTAKKRWARKFLKKHKQIRTVLEKSGKISGRLRTPRAKFIAGEKTKEALYRENGCLFRFNVDTCYFSPRLSSERKEIASKVKKGEDVLVMFGGVAPFAIVIAKLSKSGRVVSVELGRACNKYAKENVKRNKVDVKIIQGNVRRRVPELKIKFNRIVMARPNLKDSFLDVGFKAIKKGGIIHFYGFYSEKDRNEMLEMIKSEARKARKKIKVLEIKKAGEIGVRKFRYRLDLKVL